MRSECAGMAKNLLVLRDNITRKVEHVQWLPAHWGTLYELTILTDEQFANGIESGVRAR